MSIYIHIPKFLFMDKIPLLLLNEINKKILTKYNGTNGSKH